MLQDPILKGEIRSEIVKGHNNLTNFDFSGCQSNGATLSATVSDLIPASLPDA